MILDLPRFIATERASWEELEKILTSLELDPQRKMSFDEVARFHYLYQRSSSDLTRIAAFPAETRAREYLEALVARAYAEIHETRDRSGRIHPLKWFFGTLPRTFRRHINAFWLTVAITIAGSVFGAAAIHFDPDSKRVLMPFSHLMQSPAERVKHEESARTDRLRDKKSSFSAELMTHNIQVALTTLALGVTWGAGTLAILFYNGVMLGAVAGDYVQAGFAPFLLGWLLPHGVIEIPAILVAGQASFVLAEALIGWGGGRRTARRIRLRRIARDLLTLAGGAAVMLVWAGIVEAFFSQYHEPVLPYSLKIAFGCAEFVVLIVFLTRAGRT
jgi:uncharacterized membrane protein SpoIIM required for sporulation